MAKPVVDGIAHDLAGQSRVLRLNVFDEVGAQAAGRYGVRAMPTFIVFDGQGQPAHVQVGLPDRADMVRHVRQLLQKP